VPEKIQVQYDGHDSQAEKKEEAQTTKVHGIPLLCCSTLKRSSAF
jgi:hypothetical protein